MMPEMIYPRAVADVGGDVCEERIKSRIGSSVMYLPMNAFLPTIPCA
jgi:hypothetical protein